MEDIQLFNGVTGDKLGGVEAVQFSNHGHDVELELYAPKVQPWEDRLDLVFLGVDDFGYACNLTVYGAFIVQQKENGWTKVYALYATQWKAIDGEIK